MSKEESCYLLAHNHIMEPYLPLRLWSLCLILLVIQQVRCEETASILTVYGRQGESVSVPGPELKQDFTVVNWELEGKSENKSAVDYFIGTEPSVYGSYVGRVKMNLDNVSFVLEHLNKSDEGTYIVKVDLKYNRRIKVKVIDRLSVPTILSSGTDTLICKAQEVISKYSWQKEGAAIPARILLFSENDTLVISGARADICGRYTCTVENQLSSNQGHYFHLRYGEIWHEKTSLYFGIVAVLFEVPWLLTICFSCINWICKRGFSLPHVFLSFSDICGNISLVVGLFGFIFKTCGGEHVEVAMAALVVLSAILIVRVLLWFCHRKKKNHQKNACHAAWDTGSRLVVLVAISVLTGLCLKYCRKNKARQRGDKTLPPEEIQLN
ncbi:uncharacterized protein LOC121318031 isoform X2 [Polyodon spathula]|uniref:uncharacterized protein LOC121318031 isoform X2 n=1 Tax=Polyodon spathula TaxID=7913 RepID=UPI001B7DDB58|nr:uncharacterized protein LOC121318031 isoform X2 [Polyodon spathula]